jgi:pimeloyl-ACP methyl ester carboxylesterase
MTQSPPTSGGQSKTRLRIGRLLRDALIIYLAVMLIVSMLQEWLIFPGHASQGKKYALVNPPMDSELVPLKTSTGDQIYVLFCQNHTPGRPTLIFFYGNAMSLADAVGFCEGWRKLGANVLGVEYPGYGMSSGKPSEKAFYAAADAAYDYAVSRNDIDKTKIIPVGLSLGSGVAVDLASRKPVAGLMLFAAYTSLDDVAHKQLPWLPTSLILRHHFNSLQKIADLKIPILIAHGTHDSIIPTEMSHRLVAAATNAQVTSLFVDSDHNDLFELAGKQLDAAMAKFIEQIASADNSRKMQ